MQPPSSKLSAIRPDGTFLRDAPAPSRRTIPGSSSIGPNKESRLDAKMLYSNQSKQSAIRTATMDVTMNCAMRQLILTQRKIHFFYKWMN